MGLIDFSTVEKKARPRKLALSVRDLT